MIINDCLHVALLLLLWLPHTQGNNNYEPTKNVDVIIVGAGLAGLSAARMLTVNNISCTVLEASSRVGGRTRNWDTKTGKYDTITKDVVEIGGTFISPSHTSLIALGKALGFKTYNVSLKHNNNNNYNYNTKNIGEPAKTWPWWWWGEDCDVRNITNNSKALKSVFHSFDGSFEFSTPKELLNNLNSKVVQDLESIGKTMDKATRNLKTCESISDPSWEEYDVLTFEGWIREQTNNEESRVILRNMCRGMIASEPAQVSFLSIVKSMKGCWSKGDDDQYRLEGGSQAISLQMYKNNLFPIKLNTPAHKIERNEKDGKFTINDDELLQANFVIVTGTPATVAKISFYPLLDHNNMQLLQRMPMGQSMKFFVVYETAWWRKDLKYEGGIYASKMPESIKFQHPFSCQDHRPYSDERGALMCWIEGDVNIHFFNLLDDNEQKETVLNFINLSFQQVNGKQNTYKPLLFQRFNWADQPHIYGAYTGFFIPGIQHIEEFWQCLARNFGEKLPKLPNLWFAGADYWTGVGNGYMEGAVRHGESVATEIIKRIKS
jgi:monoamine oxidase